MRPPEHIRIYRDLLVELGHGHPIYEPDPGPYEHVLIGDVGYIESYTGHFVRVFNAFYDRKAPINRFGIPNDFDPLPGDLQEPALGTGLPSGAYCRNINIEKSLGFNLEGNILPAGAELELASSSEEGALIVIKEQTERVNSARRAMLGQALEQNHECWIAFVRQHTPGLELQKMLLVTGYDLASDWATTTVSETNTNVKIHFKISDAMTQTASASASVWGSWEYSSTVPVRFGPSASQRAQHLKSNSKNQCIFLRAYRMIRKPLGFKLKAAAGPHVLEPDSDDSGDMTASILINVEDDSAEEDNVYSDVYDRAFKYLLEQTEKDYVLLHDNDVPQILKAIMSLSSMGQKDGALERAKGNVSMHRKQVQPTPDEMYSSFMDYADETEMTGAPATQRQPGRHAGKLLSSMFIDSLLTSLKDSLNLPKDYVHEFERVISMIIDQETVKKLIHTMTTKLSSTEKTRLINLLYGMLQHKIDLIEQHRLRHLFLLIVSEIHELPSSMITRDVVLSGMYSGGASCDIMRGMYKNNVVAVKWFRIFLPTDTEHIRMYNEFLILDRLDHINVLPFLGVHIPEYPSEAKESHGQNRNILTRPGYPPRGGVVSPLLANGDIVQYLRCNPSSNRIAKILGIATGMEYLHTLSPAVIHRNLRVSKILIDVDGTPKISGFSIARSVDSQGVVYPPLEDEDIGEGSPRWQAPELLNREEPLAPSLASDVYAFACVCLEIFTEEVPFCGCTHDHVVRELLKGNRPPRPPQPAEDRGLTDEFWSLIQDCWATEPGDRPNMTTIVSRIRAIIAKSPPADPLEHQAESSDMEY